MTAGLQFDADGSFSELELTAIGILSSYNQLGNDLKPESGYTRSTHTGVAGIAVELPKRREMLKILDAGREVTEIPLGENFKI